MTERPTTARTSAATAAVSPLAGVDAADVARFDRLGDEWWNMRGGMRMLHRINPLRIGFIRDHLVATFTSPQRPRDIRTARSLEGLRLLDVGCGGGILCEPLARLGAAMTGIDPAPRNITVAQAHAQETELTIDYQATTAEALQATGATYNAVLAMEVIEHVPDQAAFVATLSAMVEPGGMLFVATLNRTAKSFALAIVGAEYVLGWIPRGTHRWNQFVKPDEMRRMMARGGIRPGAQAGVVFDPLRNAWSVGRDVDVNYMACGRKADAPSGASGPGR